MPYPQENTILEITTPFGPDALLLLSFQAHEQLSGLFRFDLEMVSEDPALDFKAILGQGVTVGIKRANFMPPRLFHGLVGRFVQTRRAGSLTYYRAELYPWLWLLGKTTDCRIFQKKSTPEIIKEVFDELGFADYEQDLQGTYEPREYCVQYNETALAFVSRLMEDEGIFYFFKHETGKHTLCMRDDSATNPPCDGLPVAKYRGEVNPSQFDEDVVVECAVEGQVVSGAYATSDYNFETPSTSLLASVEGEAGEREIFEYPGEHLDKGVGEARAKLRIEEVEAQAQQISGSSYCVAFSAGHTFALTEHDRKDVNTTHVLRRVVHSATGQSYSNIFEAFPSTVPFRPPRATPRPVIIGAQTAVVVGKSDEEIWTDEYGRVQVQFPWDRRGQMNEESSCFIRVSQTWAGKGWGAFFLPRIGQEVVVTFLSGDPDRPLITGSVYNAEQTVPYPLPDDQTKSTILSRSSKEGDAGNEIRFEDKKDSEELYLHAQKDMVVVVENDWTITVKHDQTATIKNDRKVTIEEGNETLTVSKGDRTVEITKGNETYSVKGTRDVTVEGDETRTNKANWDQKVSGNYTLKVDGDLTIEAKSVTIKASQAVTIEAGTELTSKAGTSLTNKAGTTLTNEAGTSLTSKASASQTVDGGGMLTIKGGMVSIN